MEIFNASLNYFDNHDRIMEIMVGVKRRLTLILLGALVPLFSIAQIDSLEALLKKTDSDSIRVRAYIALSRAYQYQNYAKAKTNSAHAMDIAEREDWDWALYESYKQEALLCSLAGDFTSALKFDNENLSVALDRHDSTALTEIFNFIGNDFNELGRYDEAYYYFIQSNQVAKAIGDSMYMNVSMHNIGSVFKELGQYDIALSHFKAARNIGQKIGDDDGLAYYHDERGDVFLRSKKYDSAARALAAARKVIAERKLGVIEHRTLTKLAQLNFELGNPDKALSYYDSTLNLHRKSDNTFGIAETNLGIAQVFVAQKKWNEAESLAKEALETGRRLNAHQLVFKSYQLLSELAEKNGDFRNALTYYKNYQAFQDSVFSNDMIQELFERQLRFVTEDKDSEIALLSREKAEQQTATRRQEFLTNILAVVVALSAIVLLTVYRSGRRRIRINRLLLEHQAEIKKRSVELEQLNQVKDKFFSIISHDLRSPMNALAGLLDLADKKHLSQDEFAQVTRELRQQFNHTKTLINNLLDWTLLQMDKLKIQEDRVDLKTMVDENIRLFSSMQVKATTINNNIPAGTFASADTNMVNLVFRNLILNAIKFTESGGLVSINSTQQNDGFILVSVADNGVGIEPEVQRILFEKTSGYSTRGTANEKGTGLGLILCKEFVEKNGGKIWLESKPGTGTIIYFTLKKA
jgi:signal transduction histidine kinase